MLRFLVRHEAFLWLVNFKTERDNEAGERNDGQKISDNLIFFFFFQWHPIILKVKINEGNV